MFRTHRIRDITKIINIPNNICCYQCKRPGDWCEAFTNRQKCTTKDIIFFIVLAGWEDNEYRKKLQNLSKITEFISFLKWLGKSIDIGSSKGINMLKGGILIGKLLLER
jgi:hypothetical protein